MKQKAKLLGSLIIVLILMSAKKENNCPPGMVRVNENLFIDRYEVTNESWKDYVHWNKTVCGVNSDIYKASLPDTTVWSFTGKGNKVMDCNYYQHSAYSEYPVVGISYEQAIEYCKWRSDRINEIIFQEKTSSNGNSLESKKDFPKIYEYRLPSKFEWEAVANINFSKKAQRKNLKKQKSQEGGVYNLASKDGEYTVPVWSYQPNMIGVYNIIGNIAEIVVEKGIVNGGAYFHKDNEVAVEKDYMFITPTNWIGFRCVCEKVEN